MQLLVSDTNILIDLEDGGLLKYFFELPYQITVPDILYYEELEQDHAHLPELGLQIQELTADALHYMTTLQQKHPKPSRNDCFALILASQESCPLLTGDRDLRIAAQQEGIDVKGTIWVVEQLVSCCIISKETACSAYNRMESTGRRLPWKEAYTRLSAL